MDKTSFVKLFNDCFEELLDTIVKLFPDDGDILSTKATVKLMRKTNPKLILTVWNDQVKQKYGEYIAQGDINFFIEKDYSQDLKDSTNSSKIIEVIDRIREPLNKLNSEQKETVVYYLQNLNIICENYITV
jgi:hypothetical protein